MVGWRQSWWGGAKSGGVAPRVALVVALLATEAPFKMVGARVEQKNYFNNATISFC